MCGIFGFISGPNSNFSINKLNHLINSLFLLSESRGKDASGIILFNNSDITIMKRPLRAKYLLRDKEYVRTIKQFENQGRRPAETLGFMGHARMVTNGSEETHDNNQPVISHEMCLLHNGIIVNDEILWSEFPNLKRKYEVDTEVALNLIWHYRSRNSSLVNSFCDMFSHLKGANSFAFVSADIDAIILATSNGSLYFSTSPTSQELIFSSERVILEKTISHHSIKHLFGNSKIVHINSGEGYIFPYENLSPDNFQLDKSAPVNKISIKERETARSIHDLRPVPKTKITPPPHHLIFGENELFVKQVNDSIKYLKRCTKCVLPETFPHIKFDENGVCNFCSQYEFLQFKGHDSLENVVQQYRRYDGRPDCLVPISGGRDSCYGLHYIKTELKLNPVAYTYDWGMVTDLARRNTSRMCGALGVEHILISADIKTKRRYVRQNVLAWLKHPVLGTIPLFMAGDKQFFYYAQMLKKQMGIDLAIFSFNRLERTDFKAAFANADESNKKSNLHEMTGLNKFQLMTYYAKEYVKNPAYINSSVIDTIFAFFSFYMIPKSFEPLYDYIRWDEETVNNTLIKEYAWETAKDTDSTWRIGDGTASFYNYIYYVMAGFSENDTFKSNQIREGMITREDAIRSIEQDNQPRYESIQWYCDTIGIDIHDALKVINSAPKLYPR
jgi:glutamine---fructose-6-phosphate transaminase (isomerizing)